MASVPSLPGGKVGGVPLVAIGGIGIVGLLLLMHKTGGAANVSTVGAGTQAANAPGGFNPPTLIPAGAGATSGQGGFISSPQNTETFGSLLGGKDLGGFLNGIGKDWTGFSLSEGGMNVALSHQNSQAQLEQLTQKGVNDVNAINAAGYQGTAIQNAQGFWNSVLNYQNTYAQNVQSQLTGYWASILQSHQNTVLNPGQTLITGSGQVTQGMPTATVNPIVNAVAQIMPTMAGNPVVPSAKQTCPPGNYSCVRGQCSPGDYGCAGSIAGWLGNNKVW